jgi:anaerobic ribonucleoside-triphosphate reductase activating protein
VYCHNSHLKPAGAAPDREWASARAFLSRRVGLLDAVVFSGGEPTLQDGLAAAMREVKGMGFLIGLHTAGAYPAKLAEVLPLVDWVGLDIKAPFERYDAVSGVPGSGAKARESLGLVVESGVDHECRTTVHPSHFSLSELVELSRTLFELGARRHVLQSFRSVGCLNEPLNASADALALFRLLRGAADANPRIEVRGA